jgi:hypothetical protein
MIGDRKVIYPCFFAFNFFKQCVSIAFQCAFASNIKRKISLVGDACCRPFITIRLHDCMQVTLERLWMR